MAVYHAGKQGAPICGTRGNGDRWNVICVSAAQWNALGEDSRCKKCAAKIRERKPA